MAHPPSGRGAVAAAVLTIALALPVPASALACYPRQALLDRLAERYGEMPVAGGVAAGQLVELLASADGASWTILLLRGDDLACPLAAGESWTMFPTSPPPGRSS